jgi:hypothetical protein
MKTKILLLILLLCFGVYLFAQHSEYEVKAALIEKFSRFVEWQVKKDPQKSFKIGVLGKKNYSNIIEELYSNWKIKGRKVEITYPVTDEEIISCDIIFISSSYTHNIKYLLELIANKQILTISDRENDLQNGIMINMYLNRKKVIYDINLTSFRKSGLKVSSLLLDAAKIVHNDTESE